MYTAVVTGVVQWYNGQGIGLVSNPPQTTMYTAVVTGVLRWYNGQGVGLVITRSWVRLLAIPPSCKDYEQVAFATKQYNLVLANWH